MFFIINRIFLLQFAFIKNKLSDKGWVVPKFLKYICALFHLTDDYSDLLSK